MGGWQEVQQHKIHWKSGPELRDEAGGRLLDFCEANTCPSQTRAANKPADGGARGLHQAADTETKQSASWTQELEMLHSLGQSKTGADWGPHHEPLALDTGQG